MQQNSFEARVEPTRELHFSRSEPLELQIWVELPLGRAEYPTRRKPSLALSLAHASPAPGVEVTKQRAPSHHLDAGTLGIVAAFLGVLALGLVAAACETILLWCLP